MALTVALRNAALRNKETDTRFMMPPSRKCRIGRFPFRRFARPSHHDAFAALAQKLSQAAFLMEMI
jgi:hypothetical protein